MTTAPNGEQPLDSDTAFGRTVYMTMFDQKVTQTALAARTGIEQSLLSKKLHGKRPWSLADMISVADALHVDLREMLGQMWGEPGDPAAEKSGTNNPCYSGGHVILGPWETSDTGHEVPDTSQATVA